MKKSQRVKANADFQRIFKRGQSTANRQFVLYCFKREPSSFRIGLSVSKKIGNAVVRNRVKRLIRQSFLEMKSDIDPSLDIIIIARKPAATLTFEETKKSLLHVLRLAKAVQRRPGGPLSLESTGGNRRPH